MSSAGKMRDRIRFDQRALDANQVRLGPWEEGFTVWAETTWLRGGEGVVAQRLEGKQPVAFSIRDSAQARMITTGFRAVDSRTQQVFDVTAASPSREPGFIDVLAVSGGAAG
ncbi:head-tail adaptor protein [Brevundimonas aurantiaca]|uniref:phage head completion protein n=1 Tax=Brevundimonas aurantiaca TaxID=74316 RepID=UPI00301A1CC9